MSTVAITWKGTVPLATAAAIVAHAFRLRRDVALPVKGGLALWPRPR